MQCEVLHYVHHAISYSADVKNAWKNLTFSHHGIFKHGTTFIFVSFKFLFLTSKL
jgi:hypothetical protein